MMTELPSIAQAYRILVQEEKYQEPSKLTQDHNDSLAFGANAASTQRSYPQVKNFSRIQGNSGNSQNTGGIGRNLSGNKRPYCEHCKVPGQYMNKCWKLYGYPPNFKPSTWKRNTVETSRVNMVQGDMEEEEGELVNAIMTSQQYKQLMKLINQSEVNGGDHSHKGEVSNATALLVGKLCLIANSHDHWILDSGAFNHMCHNLSLFSEYKSLSDNEHMITIPNGRQVSVKCIGKCLI